MAVCPLPTLPRFLVLVALVFVAGCDTRPSSRDYAAYQAALRATGDLRVDKAPADVPYTPEDLVVNFERIALHHEADASVPGSEENWAANPLMRWEGPIYWRIFGEAATDDDRTEVRTLMRRLAELTGLQIEEAGIGVNFMILITKPSERAEFAKTLAAINPALADTFRFWRRTPEVVCVANNLYSAEDDNVIMAGLVAIGSEVRGLLRRSCLHEEIVQALGLANDHPEVRPSLFNDDGEFALMTEHDEQLVRILYDPRLQAGMDSAEAMPVVRQIVAGMDLGVRGGQIAAQGMVSN